MNNIMSNINPINMNNMNMNFDKNNIINIK